jgi:serine/threonine protein kinase
MNQFENACPHPDRSEELLKGELTDPKLREFETHLEDCERCQQNLEQAAAGLDVWSEASQFLGEDAYRNSLQNSSGDLRPIASAQAKQVLQSLRPTDDPAMLGRLGSYEVSGVVGSGGMGVVLKAVDASLDRTVAIKVLAPHLASSGAARQRFEREAKAAAAVLHPNVIAIHGVSNDSELPFLVMPYLRGYSLQRRIDQEGALPTTDILRIGTQIASGLAAAHEQGLVHRDIKPANVMLEDGVERVAITDFGLARAVDDASMTKTGIIAGTPQYMSPEQARGETVDHRSDLFSLGSVLYALCTGRPPFRAESTFGMLRKITDVTPRPIREINPEMPVWLCGLINRLHEKSPEDRFDSATEVAELFAGSLAHWQNPTLVPLPDKVKAIQMKIEKQPRSSLRSRILVATLATLLSLSMGSFLLAWLAPPVPQPRSHRTQNPLYFDQIIRFESTSAPDAFWSNELGNKMQDANQHADRLWQEVNNNN